MFEELFNFHKDYEFTKNTASMERLKGVRPLLQQHIFPILKALEEKGWQPIVAQGMRSEAAQRAAVRAGNSQTMHSKHLIGAAVDITDKRYGWDGPAANLGYQYWRDQGELAYADKGLIWGGLWHRTWEHYEARAKEEESYFCDVAHIQLSDDLIEQSQEDWDNRDE